MILLKKINSLFILLIAVFFSCSNDEDNAASFIDIEIILDLKNDEGKNMFDRSTEGFIDPAKIRLYYWENEEYKLYFKENRDAQYGFTVGTNEEPSWFILYAELLSTSEVPKHIIKWNEQDSDTLRFEVDVRNNGGYVSITKVWYNEELAWDVATDNEIRRIEVIK